MSTTPNPIPWRSRDWSDLAADWLLVVGVILLIGLNPGGVFIIWFATRIRQRRDDFRRIVVFLLGGTGLVAIFCLTVLPFRMASGTWEFDRKSISEPLWVHVGLLILMAIAFFTPAVLLTPRGTREAHARQASSGTPASTHGRPTYWIPLLRFAHAPFILFSVLLLGSLARPAPMRMSPPPGAGTQWEWLSDRIRFEEWSAPFSVREPHTSTSSPERSGEMLVIESHTRVYGGGGGFLEVHESRSYEFRFVVALIYAAASTVLSIVVEVLWRWRPERPAGLCRICGYDLRATSDRCPECGTLVLPAARP